MSSIQERLELYKERRLQEQMRQEYTLQGTHPPVRDWYTALYLCFVLQRTVHVSYMYMCSAKTHWQAARARSQSDPGYTSETSQVLSFLQCT